MILALVGALLIGLTLGVLGSGGSILTVPVLVYLVGQPEKVAVAGSLAIVGVIAAAGTISYARRGSISWRSVVYFGVPGMAGTYAGAWLSRFVSGAVQLALFALVMLLAAYFMLRSKHPQAPGSPEQVRTRSTARIVADGGVVGVITGLVGVGGGFLIIPALVVLGGMAMQPAVGTSLAIIALKSASGFAKYLHVLAEQGLRLDWNIIGLFALFGIAGSLAGAALAPRLPQHLLKQAFGVLLVMMGAFILWNTLPKIV